VPVYALDSLLLPVMPSSILSQPAGVHKFVALLPELDLHPGIVDLVPALARLQTSSGDPHPELQRTERT
jgi:hypothetical protein